MYEAILKLLAAVPPGEARPGVAGGGRRLPAAVFHGAMVVVRGRVSWVALP